MVAWDGEVAWQSRRTAIYQAALERLRAGGYVYRCRCSRKEIADSGLVGLEGAIYPGTCRHLAIPPGPGLARAPAKASTTDVASPSPAAPDGSSSGS